MPLLHAGCEVGNLACANTSSMSRSFLLCPATGVLMAATRRRVAPQSSHRHAPNATSRPCVRAGAAGSDGHGAQSRLGRGLRPAPAEVPPGRGRGSAPAHARRMDPPPPTTVRSSGRSQATRRVGAGDGRDARSAADNRHVALSSRRDTGVGAGVLFDAVRRSVLISSSSSRHSRLSRRAAARSTCSPRWRPVERTRAGRARASGVEPAADAVERISIPVVA